MVRVPLETAIAALGTAAVLVAYNGDGILFPSFVDWRVLCGGFVSLLAVIFQKYSEEAVIFQSTSPHGAEPDVSPSTGRPFLFNNGSQLTKGSQPYENEENRVPSPIEPGTEEHYAYITGIRAANAEARKLEAEMQSEDEVKQLRGLEPTTSKYSQNGEGSANSSAQDEQECGPITELKEAPPASAVHTDQKEAQTTNATEVSKSDQQSDIDPKEPCASDKESELGWAEPTSTLQAGKNNPTLVNCWRDVEAKHFKLRGKMYLTEKKPQKVPSPPAMFAAWGAQTYMRGDGGAPLFNLAEEAPCLGQHIRSHPEAFYFIVGWNMPGPPFRSVAFVFRRSIPVGEDPAFDAIFQDFLDGTDEQRKERFKYLPRLDVAPSMVMSGVRMMGGEKPTMLCKKLTPRFFRGVNYMEVNIDISSSKVANMVTGLIVPKIEGTITSHAFLLQANDESELPERCLGCIKVQRVDMIPNTVVV